MDKNVDKEPIGRKSDQIFEKETKIENDISNENRMYNKNMFSSYDNPEENIKYSFHNFVKEFQGHYKHKKAPWNKERERCMRESQNKKRIFLKEINEFDLNVN